MNKVILVGRLTRDPDVRYTTGNEPMAVARFTLAVDRRVARNAGNNTVTADFISCLAFQKKAEFLEKYCKQGTKLVLEGRIQTGSYTNRDNQKVYTTDVVAENLEFAESKGSSQGSQQTAPQQPTVPPTSPDGFMYMPDGIDEELPFN